MTYSVGYSNYVDYVLTYKEILIPLTIISVAISIFMLICEAKIFEKFGEPGWKVLIPIYNSYILFEYTWGNGWYFLLTLVPFIDSIVSIITYWKLGRSFNWSAGKCIGLMFLPVIFMPIMALSPYEDYYGAP